MILHPKVFAYACHGANLFAKGHLDEAKNYLAQATEFNKRAKQFWWNFGCNHYLEYDKERTDEAEKWILQAIKADSEHNKKA